MVKDRYLMVGRMGVYWRCSVFGNGGWGVEKGEEKGG
jgi:hypothetical protein